MKAAARYIFAPLLAALLLLSAGARAQEDPFTILFLGDSLTAGYGLREGQSFPALIEARLREEGYGPDQVRILNGGVSGSTSASALNRLQWHIRAEPDLMLLSLGANDGLRGLSIEQMEANLRETIEFAQGNGLRVALTGMMVPPNLGKDYSADFQAVFPRLAQDYDLPFMPFLLEGVAAEPELNQADGVHPNAEGARIIAENVYDFLKPLLPAAGGDDDS